LDGFGGRSCWEEEILKKVPGKTIIEESLSHRLEVNYCKIYRK